jgi:hypothetical protein
MTMTTFKVPEDLSFKVTLIAEARAAQAQSLKSKKGFTHFTQTWLTKSEIEEPSSEFTLQFQRRD